ncbi:hypothetical protein FHS89_001755 [Rubricella aquisinus]|uniref:Apea-like HEPN domain-containing protein n=1 Tax=Rubricella aquisinus TaxID=2028108 RepID=A0A840X1G4_9RHOB|nr:hypothetical protein [Rubricella aquisinus]MBB5515735.1 hypothetical protein [Rubricella aquisinus]
MQMSTELFATLVASVEASSDRALSNNDAPRWIRKLSEEDAILMSQADVRDVCIVTRHLRALLLQHEGKRFLTVSGLDADDDLPEGFEALELTPSFLALAVSQLKLAPRASPIEIFDTIESSFAGEDGYEGHELEDIAKLFPSVSVFKLNEDADSSGSIWRSVGVLLSKFYGQGPIELSGEALNGLKELYEAGSNHVPFRNIVQGHLAITWSGLFLELYRAIEQLYSVPKLVKLTDIWASPKSFYELAELLESQLGWRPKEEDALRELIESCDASLLEMLANELCPDAENKSQAVAKAIYKQRNSLVHFRSAMPEQCYSNEQWNNRICLMIKLVSQLYERHGNNYMLPRAQ